MLLFRDNVRQSLRTVSRQLTLVAGIDCILLLSGDLTAEWFRFGLDPR